MINVDRLLSPRRQGSNEMFDCLIVLSKLEVVDHVNAPFVSDV